MGANAQVALEKFARYFEVEARILDVSEGSKYRLDPNLVKKNIDENTIGVFIILGSTYTGHYEPVEEISKILDEFEAKTGVDIPIHVDAASGEYFWSYLSLLLSHLKTSSTRSDLVQVVSWPRSLLLRQVVPNGTFDSLELSPSILLVISSVWSTVSLCTNQFSTYCVTP